LTKDELTESLQFNKIEKLYQYSPNTGSFYSSDTIVSGSGFWVTMAPVRTYAEGSASRFK